MDYFINYHTNINKMTFYIQYKITFFTLFALKIYHLPKDIILRGEISSRGNPKLSKVGKRLNPKRDKDMHKAHHQSSI